MVGGRSARARSLPRRRIAIHCSSPGPSFFERRQPFIISGQTGNIRSAGTDSNVSIDIVGEGGSTGKQLLRDSVKGGNKVSQAWPYVVTRSRCNPVRAGFVGRVHSHGNKVAGKAATGHCESRRDRARLIKLQMSDLNGTVWQGSAWFLDWVEVTCPEPAAGKSGDTVKFWCRRWLDEQVPVTVLFGWHRCVRVSRPRAYHSSRESWCHMRFR